MANILKRGKKNVGLIVISIGVGLIFTVIIPFWGWIVAAGIALIYWGVHIMGKYNC